jgi:ABC-type amino acid transport substrate-binding protein
MRRVKETFFKWIRHIKQQWKPRLFYVIAGVAMLAVFAVIAVNSLQMRWLADKQWNDIHNRGTLRIGIDPGWQPFSFYDSHGWSGMDAELGNELARRMGLSVQTIPVGYDSMYDALHMWQVDMVMSAVTIDPARTADYAYSTAYFDAGLRLVAPITASIKSVNDLSGKRVAVTLGTPADDTARFWERRLANMQRIDVTDDQVAARQLQHGEVDAMIVDALNAGKLQSTQNQLLVISIAPLPYVIAVRRDNPWLLSALDNHLQELRDDGLLQAIIDKWTN